MRALEVSASNLRLFGALVVLVVALGLGIGLALSASVILANHAGDGLVHACVNRVSGVMRHVQDSDQCTRYEQLVEWQGMEGSASLEARVAALESENETQQGEIDLLEGRVTALEEGNTTLQAEIDALNAQVPDCLMTEGIDAVFNGCNVHVRDGSDDTDGATNGLGNLIVGYNEERSVGNDRTGSHNLVVGEGHDYSSYGGFVAGRSNSITAPSASVSGGTGNTASGGSSSVSGGGGNTASGTFSSVSGGLNNSAIGIDSSVSGGSTNRAVGDQSSVSGGTTNTANGTASSISGGSLNTTGPNANAASVSGGLTNSANGAGSSVSGGFAVTAPDAFNWAAGGLLEVS